MRKWLAIAGILTIAVLAFAACGDGGDDESADADDLSGVSDGAASGATYRVTVNFNETVEQADLDEAAAILSDYDPLIRDLMIRETFPPTGDATLSVDDPEFCDDVVTELEAKSYVDSVDCVPQLDAGDLQGEDDGSGSVSSPGCAPDVPDCEDMIVNGTCLENTDCSTDGGAPALPPDDGVAPTSGEYQIRISFNTSVQQDQIDEVGAMIRDFDPDAEYVVQESFPPTGVGNFVADTQDACLALTQELEQASFVRSVSCEPYVQLEPGDLDPDDPVTNDLG